MSERAKGATSVKMLFRLTDSTTGLAKSGVDVTTLKLQYERPGEAVGTATSLTLLAALTTAWTSYGAKECDATNSKGVYRVDPPDAAFATGADEVTLSVSGTGIETATRLVDLMGADMRDAVRLGLTALPNATAGANGGLPLGDASGRVDLGKILGTASVGAVGYVGVDWGQVANKTTTNALTGTTISTTQAITSVSGAVGSVTGAVGSVTGAVGSVTARVTANADQWAGGTIPAPNVTGVPLVDAKYLLGTIFATPATAGILDANAKNVNNVSTSSVTTINANVGTTQPTNFTGSAGSALVKSDVVDIAGAAVSASTAQLGVNVVNIAGTVSAGTAGYVGIDWGQVTNKTTTNVLSGTTIGTLTTYTGNTVQTGDAYARIGAAGAGLTALGDTRIANLDAAVTSRLAPTVSGRTLDVTAGGEAGIDWANIGSPTTTVVLSGTTVGTITTYTGDTPQTGDSYARIGAAGAGLTAVVLATPPPTAAAIAIATRDVSNTSPASSSLGAAVNSAASAGDPWSTALPGPYGSGTAGYIVGTNLNATVSSRLAPTVAARTLDVSATGEAGVDWANVGSPTTSVVLSGTTVGTLTTYTGNTVQTGDAYARIGAAGAGLTSVTAATVSDKTGYSLAAAGLDAVTIESGVNARQALSGILASAAGILSGAATTTVVVKGGNVATTRITATVDSSGNRSAVTLSLPT